MSAEIIKSFNEILGAFLSQISDLIGSHYHVEFQKIVKYNSLLPVEQFFIYAFPDKDKIVCHDESYFVDVDTYKNKIGDADNILSEVLRLKGVYDKFDSDGKEVVWDVFNELLRLCEGYVKIKYKLK